MKIVKVITCLVLVAIAIVSCKKESEQLVFGTPPPLKTVLKDTTPKNVMYPIHRQRPTGLISGQ